MKWLIQNLIEKLTTGQASANKQTQALNKGSWKIKDMILKADEASRLSVSEVVFTSFQVLL